MLQVDNIVFKGLILIYESKETSALPVWYQCLTRASNLNFNVDVVLLSHLASDLPGEILSNKRINVHEDFVFDLSVADFRSYLLSLSNNEVRSLLFLDSTTCLLRRFGVERIASIISELMESGRFVAVIAPINEAVIMSSTARQLASLASVILYVSSSLRNCEQQLLCAAIKQKRDGFSSKDICKSHINEKIDVLSTIQKNDNDIKNTSTAHNANSLNPFETLPFDVGVNLRESEKRAKADVQLPYTSAQDQKGIVNVNLSTGRIRMGGQVVYTPDDNDDLDESDPDDDLMI